MVQPTSHNHKKALGNPGSSDKKSILMAKVSPITQPPIQKVINNIMAQFFFDGIEIYRALMSWYMVALPFDGFSNMVLEWIKVV